MPHSTADQLSHCAKEDIEVPDAPSPDRGVSGSEGSRDGSVVDTSRINRINKEEVKLEDLFNDDQDDNDEYNTSSASVENGGFSPPAAPV